MKIFNFFSFFGNKKTSQENMTKKSDSEKKEANYCYLLSSIISWFNRPWLDRAVSSRVSDSRFQAAVRKLQPK